MKKFLFSDPKFQITGRVDTSNPENPMLIWPGSYVRFEFKGTHISLKIDNQRFWIGRFLGVVIDGDERCIPMCDGEQTLMLAENLPDTHHEVFIYKRMEGHYITLKELYLNDSAELLVPSPKPQKRIEVYGDSVSAGSVVDCNEYLGKHDPENHGGFYDNSWHAYPLMLSRALPAEVFVTSQGGIAIFDKTGYFEMPNMRGVESCYDKLGYCIDRPLTPWDWHFKPHVIVFAVGQNDSGPDYDCLRKPDYYKKWTDKYIEIANDVRSHSPNATIIFAMTVLNHDPIWDDAMEDIKNRMGGEENKVYHFVYSRCGRATPGHPRVAEQEEMANELKAFLESLPESTWED